MRNADLGMRNDDTLSLTGISFSFFPQSAIAIPHSDADCIHPPQTIEAQAKAKSKEDTKPKDAFESGKAADLNTLTVKQLQTLAKQNGVSIARTKSDFIKLLDQVEPGIDHFDLTGVALKSEAEES